MAAKPEKVVADIGRQLDKQTRPTTNFLVKKLSQAARALSKLDQLSSLKSFIRPLRQYLVEHDLLHHTDKDVKLQVAICFCEIIRILAPDPSFDDKTFKDIFELLIGMFMELANTRSSHFERIVKILETVAALECCRHMLDLECDDLILKMFKVFFSVVRDKHQPNVINGMLSIMSLILNEEDTSQPLLEVILQNLRNRAEGPAPASYHLAVSLVQRSAERIKPAICGFLTSCILDRENVSSDLKESYHEIIFEIFQCAPNTLGAIIPNLVQELVTDQVDVRIKSVNLIGKLLMLPKDIHEHHNLFVELLKRFSDKSAEVRVSVIRAVKSCYMAYPSRVESHKILSSLEARLLDFDASVRTEAVTVVCDLAKFNLKNFPGGLIARSIDRLRDKMTSVRKEALRKLLEVYHDYCMKCFDGQMMLDECYEQIPCKILMLSFDKNLKEFRPQNLELLLAENLFPASLSMEHRTRHWIYLYSLFTPAHNKALNLILCQKRRFQKEMQSYLSLWKKDKGIDPEEVNMRIEKTFTRMSAAFLNADKAEESFVCLNELKDSGVFDLLLQLLHEPAFLHAKTLRDEFLKKIGEKHPHFEFLEALSLKCSNSIFGSEHVHYILNHVSASRYTHNDLEGSSVNLLYDISRNFPILFRGSEHQLKLLMMEDDLALHGKLTQILANLGSYISTKISEIYPQLEKLCLEGTRAQAKSAISVIAALVGPSEKFLVEDLCQKLVQLLFGERNIPTVLQSLGCISQHFVLEFQKHRNEVTSYIRERIFEETITEAAVQFDQIAGCEVCFGCKMKIYGLKLLVKSVLPNKEVHGKEQISYLLDILSKLLLTAKFAEETTACDNDISYVKLVAAKSVLRLSRWWDLHISPQIFQLTIMMAKDASCFVRKAYIDKIHKLLKEHAVTSKFACAFALTAASDCARDLKDVSVRYLIEFIEEYGRAAPNCPASGVEEFSTNCAAYVVVFLLHVLAHDAVFPPLNSNSEELFAQFCRPLVLILCLLVDAQFIDRDMDLVKEVFVYLRSIFRAIKRAEDAINAEKTSNLHILADIGIVVLNVLKHDGLNLAPAPGLVLLPSSLYTISSRRKTEDNSRPLTFALNEQFVTKLIDAFESDFAQLSSTTAKRARRCPSDNLQDQNNVALGMSKDSELSRNVAQRAKVAKKDMAETHILEACIRGKQQTKIVCSSPRTAQLQDVPSTVEELGSDDPGNFGHLSTKEKLDSNSANVELCGTVSDVSTEEIPLLLAQTDERKQRGRCESADSPKRCTTKLRHGCASDGSTVSLQQRDPKKRRFGDNAKATLTCSGGIPAEMQRIEDGKRKVLVDRTNTLAVNFLQGQCQPNKSSLIPKISVDTSASDVSDVARDAIAFRTRRRKV